MAQTRGKLPVSYEVEWLPLGALFLDTYIADGESVLPTEALLAYQRQRDKYVREIVGTGFNSDLFGTLVVNTRSEGRYAVVDGGTRFRALLELEYGPKTLVPCLVHRWDARQEVRNFIEWNTRRLHIGPVDKFVAKCRLGIEPQVSIEALLQTHTGLGVFPNQWGCVGALEIVWGYDRGKSLQTTLEILSDLGWPTKPRGRTQYILGGVGTAVYSGVRPKLALKRWADLEPTYVVERSKEVDKSLSAFVDSGRGAGSTRRGMRGTAVFLIEHYNAKLGSSPKVIPYFLAGKVAANGAD